MNIDARWLSRATLTDYISWDLYKFIDVPLNNIFNFWIIYQPARAGWWLFSANQAVIQDLKEKLDNDISCVYK